MIVFCNQYSATPLESAGALEEQIEEAIRDQLAARCYCTAPSTITSLTVDEDYATGNTPPAAAVSLPRC